MGEKKKQRGATMSPLTTRYGSGQRRKNRYIVLPPSFSQQAFRRWARRWELHIHPCRQVERRRRLFFSIPRFARANFSSQGFHAHIICTRTRYSLTYDTCQVPVAGRGIREVYREYQQSSIEHHSACIANISRVSSSITAHGEMNDNRARPLHTLM